MRKISEKVVNRRIPVTFQKIEEIDERFMKVKIWLMHLGENYNGSYFNKDVVAKAIPSLANTPIVGFIQDNISGEDFSDHRMELEKKDGKYKFKYKGQAYGVIPQDNNAQFEFRVGSDGVEREYLTVEGLLWTKWDESIGIMDRDEYKDQSMELYEDADGYFDDDLLFHFTNFKFYGACVLGSGVMPGMESASIEKHFSQDSFQKEMQEKMEEFKVAFERYQQSLVDDTNKSKDGEDMKEKFLEILAKYSLTEDDEKVQAIVLENYSTEEELDAAIAEIAKGEETPAEPEVPTPDEPVVPDPNFSEEIEALKVQLDAAKAEFESLQSQFNAITQEKEQVESKFSSLSQEVEELRNYKSQKLQEERQVLEDELFSSFESTLTEDEIKSVREASVGKELSEIEVSLYALLGKKNFQKPVEDAAKGNVRVAFQKPVETDDGYGGLLNKHIKS